MELKGIVNIGLLAGLGYAIYCGYQYVQFRNALLEELSNKPGIKKVVGDLGMIKINISQYAPLKCASGFEGNWTQVVLQKRSSGCFRVSLGLQGETLKTVKLSADYDSSQKIGERLSYVMLCKNSTEVLAKDHGLPREYENCE